MDGVTHADYRASEGQGAAARPPRILLDSMAASFHMHTHTHAYTHTHTHTCMYTHILKQNKTHDQDMKTLVSNDY